MDLHKKQSILGIHFGHDAGAAIVVDGQIVADVSEERFNRCKHSGDDPFQSIEYCLKAAGLNLDDIDEIAVAGSGSREWVEAIFGIQLDEPKPDGRWKLWRSLFLKFLLRGKKSHKNGPIKVPLYLRNLFLKRRPLITFVEHHLAHAACAYYTSNDKRKMIIATMDGVGDRCSSCIWLGENGKISPLVKYGRNSSIGWFYSNVTEALHWWHGDGEGKTMGLAPYGDAKKCPKVLDGLYPVFRDGALVGPYTFPEFTTYDQMSASHWHSDDASRIAVLVGKYGRENIAAEAQRVLEEQVMEFVLPWLKKENTKILATSGGIFLNVKLNQRIWMSGDVETFYPYHNPGDAGLAVGSALHVAAKNGQLATTIHDHSYWGPEYTAEEIENTLIQRGIDYEKCVDVSVEAAKYLADDKIVGWFQGRMETGPRSLGNRAILMSPKKQENKDIINARVKFREAFRPFCPSLTVEAKDKYLVKARTERFMIMSFDCVPERKLEVPAVVHVDGTMRPQTVSKEDNPRYWKLISEFGRLTGTPVVLNTSMNIRGEPIVCTPRDAIRCFFDSGMHVLFLGDFVIRKQRWT